LPINSLIAHEGATLAMDDAHKHLGILEEGKQQ
jgi:hypothetical protein